MAVAATSFFELVAYAGPSLRAPHSATDQLCRDWTRRNHLHSDSGIPCRFSSRTTRACLSEGAAHGHDIFKGLSFCSSSPTFTSASSQFSELLSQTVPIHRYPNAVSSGFGFSQSLPPATVKAKRRGCTTRAIALGDAIEEGKAEGDNTEGFSSIGDFTRLSSEGKRVELQTAIVTYWKRASWWDVLKPDVQVDLVAAVHIADKEYFETLQEELDSYDRVLYEMVADKKPAFGARAKLQRWRPPKPNSRRRRGFSIVGSIQKLMSSLLCLDFQLECMDYTGPRWYHADLDLATFQKLQKDRGESLFTIARDASAASSKAIMRSIEVPSDLNPIRRWLLWAAKVVPMPLLALFLIQGVVAPPGRGRLLQELPEMNALLNLDLAQALKLVLAKQITGETFDVAKAVMEESVIIGERNKRAVEELSRALGEGCRRVAVFYGSGHLPDLDRRLREDFGFRPVEVQWRTAWAITGTRRAVGAQNKISKILGRMAKITKWPVNRYQTTAVLLFSVVLALDLYFWELLLQGADEYVVGGIAAVAALLDQGWGL